MSREIDERVVEMKFDNKDFEKNVETSMSTLEKLKQSLKFGDSAKELESLGNATKGFSLDGIASGVQTVQDRFSAMSIVAITALQNITNSAINTGKQLVASLSTDQIVAGWDKYADKTSAVQTIMAATAKDFSDTGEQMEYVNGQLEKLNWFTDETSYNFLDMVSNIGKFTSNGVKLDTAVTAMEGISTWAAISGANTQEASRAMYNLSQALAVGSVKLIDWKSIENANMATVEFKQTAIDTAVALGTLTEVGDGLYETLDGNEVSVSNFNENLKDTWFSSEVLLETLNRYGGFTDKLYEASEAMSDQYDTVSELISAVNEYKEGTLDLQEVAANTGLTIEEVTGYFDDLADSTQELGRKSFAAAQEAKTFQEAIDATKDAVSTGWMNTFELIFGNYEEAKKLWTNVANELYDVFASSSEARNEMLGEWKKLGGRDIMLEALSNAWEALKHVIETVKEAFRDIFPAMTGERLVEITERVRDLTEKFKMSEETTANLKNTFRGLFAILDIGKQLLSAVFGSFSSLLSVLPGAGSGILGITGSIGEYIVKLDDAIRENEVFTRIFQTITDLICLAKDKISAAIEELAGLSIGEIFKKAGDMIANAFNNIRSAIQDFSGIESSGISDFVNKIKSSFSPLDSLSEKAKALFDVISGIAQKIGPILSNIGNSITDKISNIWEFISKNSEQYNLQTLLDVLKTGAFVAAIMQIKEVFGSLEDITSGVTDVLESISDCFESYQKKLKADMLLEIAAAIGILAASIVALTLVDQERLLSAVEVMTTMFVELFGSMAILSKVLNTEGMESFGKLAGVAAIMMGLSTAILILAAAISKLAKIDYDEIAKGLITIGALALILVASAKNLSEVSGSFAGAAVGLILFSTAITSLIPPLLILGLLPLKVIAQGLGAMAIALAEVTATMKLLPEDTLSKSAGLLMMSVAINALVVPLSILGLLPLEVLGKGLAAVGASLLIMAAATRLMTDSLAGAAAMLVMAIALDALTPALVALSLLSWEGIAKGLVAIAGAFAVFAVAGLALGVISPILLAVGGAMALFGVGVLSTVTALLLLAPALAALVVPGTAAVGVISLCAAAVAELVPLIAEKMAEAVVAFLEVLATAIPRIKLAVVSLLLAITEAVNEIVPSIVEIIVTIVDALTTSLGEHMPSFVDSGYKIMLALMHGLADNIGEIAETAIDIVRNFLEAISSKTGDVVESAYNIVINFVEGLATAIEDNTQRLRDALIKLGAAMVKAFMDFFGIHSPSTVMKDVGENIVQGIIEGVGNKISAVKDKILEVGKNILDSIKNFFGIHSPSTVMKEVGENIVQGGIEGIGNKISAAKDKILEVGKNILDSIKNFFGISSSSSVMKEVGENIIQGIIEGIGNKIAAAKEKMAELGTGILNSFKSLLGINSPSTVMSQQGEYLVTGLTEGINRQSGSARDAMNSIGQSMLSTVNGFKDSFSSSGYNIVQGLINGVKNNLSSVTSVASSIGEKLLSGVKSVLKIESPSKEMFAIGKYSDEGLANGLATFSDKVDTAAFGVGKEALYSLSSTLSGIDSILDDDFPDEPVIRPVLDLSDIEKGAGRLNSMLDMGQTFKMASTNGVMMGERLAIENKETDGSNLSGMIENLNRDVISMRDAMDRLRNVMGTGVIGSSVETAIRDAMSDVGVYLDGRHVGKLITDYQNNITRGRGLA